MQLQTKIPIQQQESRIDYNAQMLLLGSCFAENIGAKFEYFKFKNLQNPFGVLFHSKAIETFLWMVTQGESYTEADLFYRNEQWHCFDAHSKLSDPDQSRLLLRLNAALQQTQESLRSASNLIITLGTSWVYRLKELDMIVANCHKIPQSAFTKELLSVDEITHNLSNIVSLVKSVNPTITITWTVSPVRHIKDGFVKNMRSKSHLITAIHQIIDPAQKLHYFPSYEIVMDELRDYRFYAKDMIHPSEVAIDYIWERFKEVWVDSKAGIIMKNVDTIQKGMSHRPFNQQSKQHQRFIEDLENKKLQLQKQFPHIQF